MTRRTRNDTLVLTRVADFRRASQDQVQAANVARRCRLALARIDNAGLDCAAGIGAQPASVLAARLELSQRIALARLQADQAFARADSERVVFAATRTAARTALDLSIEFKRSAAGVEQRKCDARAVPIAGSARP